MTICMLALLVMIGGSLTVIVTLMPFPKIDHRTELTEAFRRLGYFRFST